MSQVELAQKVIAAYADGFDGLSDDECLELLCRDPDNAGAADQCVPQGFVLRSVLKTGSEGVVTDEELRILEKWGFSADFRGEFAKFNGKRALYERVKWLAETLENRSATPPAGWQSYRCDLDHLLLEAVKELEEIGPDAKGAVPVLFKTLDYPGKYVGFYAAQALGKIGFDGKAAVPMLLDLLADPNPYVRDAAACTLSKIGPDAKEAIPALIESLKDESDNVGLLAAVALGEIGPDAKDAVPALIEVYNSPRSISIEGFQKVDAAIWALGKMGPAAKKAVPMLKRALNDRLCWQTRDTAAEALGEMGPDARDAVPALIRGLRQSMVADLRRLLRLRPPSGHVAAEALGKIGSKKAIPILLKASKCDDEKTRRAAAKALERLGYKDRSRNK